MENNWPSPRIQHIQITNKKSPYFRKMCNDNSRRNLYFKYIHLFVVLQNSMEQFIFVLLSLLMITLGLLQIGHLQSHFPTARITIRNGRNEPVTMAFARMIMANQTLAMPPSTFSVFPAVVSFGTGKRVINKYKRNQRTKSNQTNYTNMSSSNSNANGDGGDGGVLTSLRNWDTIRQNASSEVVRHENSNIDIFSLFGQEVATCHISMLLPFSHGNKVPFLPTFEDATSAALAAHHHYHHSHHHLNLNCDTSR